MYGPTNTNSASRSGFDTSILQYGSAGLQQSARPDGATYVRAEIPLHPSNIDPESAKSVMVREYVEMIARGDTTIEEARKVDFPGRGQGYSKRSAADALDLAQKRFVFGLKGKTLLSDIFALLHNSVEPSTFVQMVKSSPNVRKNYTNSDLLKALYFARDRCYEDEGADMFSLDPGMGLGDFFKNLIQNHVPDPGRKAALTAMFEHPPGWTAWLDSNGNPGAVLHDPDHATVTGAPVVSEVNGLTQVRGESVRGTDPDTRDAERAAKRHRGRSEHTSASLTGTASQRTSSHASNEARAQAVEVQAVPMPLENGRFGVQTDVGVFNLLAPVADQTDMWSGLNFQTTGNRKTPFSGSDVALRTPDHGDLLNPDPFPNLNLERQMGSNSSFGAGSLFHVPGKALQSHGTPSYGPPQPEEADASSDGFPWNDFMSLHDERGAYVIRPFQPSWGDSVNSATDTQERPSEAPI